MIRSTSSCEIKRSYREVTRAPSDSSSRTVHCTGRPRSPPLAFRRSTNCSPTMRWMTPVAPKAPVRESVEPTTIGSPLGGATDGTAADASALAAVEGAGADDADGALDAAGEQAASRPASSIDPRRLVGANFTCLLLSNEQVGGWRAKPDLARSAVTVLESLVRDRGVVQRGREARRAYCPHAPPRPAVGSGRLDCAAVA